MSQPEAAELSPAWRAGQYVTYYMQREDGVWLAFALSILGKDQNGVWVISGKFKTAGGEAEMLFISNPQAPANAMDPVPARNQRRRSTAPPGVELPPDIDPMMFTSVALNLMLVRRALTQPVAIEPPRRVALPCGIDQARMLISPAPGYMKHHALNPRVMITGVAEMSIDGHRNPVIATSFGFSDPDAAIASSFDDHIDLSHAQPIDHDGFSLTYPATWFFDVSEGDLDGTHAIEHAAELGGITCSLSCTITIRDGDRATIAALFRSEQQRLSSPLPGLSNPRSSSSIKLQGDAWLVRCTLDQPGIEGGTYTMGVLAPDGARFARINIVGCAAVANPRCAAILADIERAIPPLLESFRLR